MNTEAIVLVFAEKDHLEDKRPGMKAGSGDSDSAWIAAVHPCREIAAAGRAAKRPFDFSPFAAIGVDEISL